MVKIDIFIRTYENDFHLLIFSLKSIIENLSGYNKIIICVKENELNILKNFLNKNNLDISCINIVNDINYNELYQTYNKPDYCGQQISKLKADIYSDAEYIMYTDCDVIFYNKHNIIEQYFDNEKILYMRRKWNDSGSGIIWKKCLEYLNLITDYEFMCSHPFIYPTDIIKQTRNYIMNINNNISFEDQCFYIYKNYYFSEFNILGSFAYLNNYNNNIKFIYPIEYNAIRDIKHKQFYSYSDSDNLKNNIKSILQIKHNLNFISMIDDDEISKTHNNDYNIKNKYGVTEINFDEINFEKINFGEFNFIVHKNDTYINNTLKTGILFENLILSFIKQFIDPNKNIIYIGAYIGTHAIIYSNLINKNVFAFEPQTVIFDILNINVKANNCKNIITYNYGASNKNNTYYMNANYEKKNNMGTFTIVNYITEVKIECIMIDLLDFNNIGLIKIDVYDHQFEILQGIKNTILECNPIILIKIHDSCITRNQVLNLLHELKYVKFYKLTDCDYLFMQ